MDIVAGHWVNRVNYIHSMLNVGANSITKFPAIKLFNTKFAKTIEKETKKAGYKFQGTFTKMPKINFKEIKNLSYDEKLKNDIIRKVKEYLKTMNKN